MPTSPPKKLTPPQQRRYDRVLAERAEEKQLVKDNKLKTAKQDRALKAWANPHTTGE